MIDLGITKLALIAIVALLVLGPERLPHVARTLGALLGRAQRYLRGLKAEVSRELELDVLRKVRDELAQTITTVDQQVYQHLSDLHTQLNPTCEGTVTSLHTPNATGFVARVNPVRTKRLKRFATWRSQQAAVPRWFKQRVGLRSHILSGAARIHRYRPRNGLGKCFFDNQ